MERKNLMMIIASLLPLGLFIFPLWNITLEAPQYPVPLGMDIFINRFSDVNEFDIKNINIMNHYVGMKEIPNYIKEFKIFPTVVIFMSILGFFIGFSKKYKLFLLWFILMFILSVLGVYDFYLWEHDYGMNLNPKAILKFTNEDGSIMGFQPPLFGTQNILNFKVHSYPRLGGLFLFTSLLLSLIAYILTKNSKK